MDEDPWDWEDEALPLSRRLVSFAESRQGYNDPPTVEYSLLHAAADRLRALEAAGGRPSVGGTVLYCDVEMFIAGTSDMYVWIRWPDDASPGRIVHRENVDPPTT